jgi:hypothetical protein
LKAGILEEVRGGGVVLEVEEARDCGEMDLPVVRCGGCAAACCLAIYIRRNVRKSQVNVRMDGSPVVLEGVTFKKK